MRVQASRRESRSRLIARTSRTAAGAVAVSTLEDCWEAVCKKHPDELRDQVSERWFQLLERVVPGKDQADFGPEDWGRALADIALPF